MTQEQKTKISEHFDELHAIVSDYGLNVPNDIRDALRAAYLAGADYALDIYSPHWISVDKGLPTNSDDVLVCDSYGCMRVSYYHNVLGKWSNCDTYFTPTHWMPLPQPPKKGGEE